MAIYFIDGFDHVNSFADLQTKGWGATAGSLALTSAIDGGSGRALVVGSGTFRVVPNSPTQGFLWKRVTFGHWLKLTSFNTQAGIWIWNGSQSLAISRGQGPPLTKQCQISVRFLASGAIEVFLGNFAQGVDGSDTEAAGHNVIGISPPGVFQPGIPFFFELSAKIDTISGDVTIRVNNNTVFTASGIQTAQVDLLAGHDGNDYAFMSVITWGGISSGMVIDSFYIGDDAVGSGPSGYTSFLGAGLVNTCYVNSNSSPISWSPSDGIPGDNNKMVQEAQMDSGATYNQTSASGQEDLFTITQLPVGAVPLIVQVTGAYSASFPSLTVKQHLKSGLNDVSGHSFVPTGGASFSYVTDIWAYDVADVTASTAWTRSSVDAANIGYATA